ncbi:hypothetical protein Pmani_019218 [Petrolisthes manimaculis]|uniref:Uncharacterized protein n=1 Tax=Petrolisthes manimaculis TaxID=1843537 RepID=A0AAE1PL78_9EUCA|nr:hypothetical protein Pmani_019218 [Petrolisthes manimaculis]
MKTAAGGEGGAVSEPHHRRPRQRQFGPYGHSNTPAAQYTSNGNTHSGNDGIYRYSENTGNQNYDASNAYNNHYVSSGLSHSPEYDSAMSNNHQNYNNEGVYSNSNYENSGHFGGQQMNHNTNGGDFYSQSLEQMYRNHNGDQYNTQRDYYGYSGLNQQQQLQQQQQQQQQLRGWNDRHTNWDTDLASYMSRLNPQLAPQQTIRGGSGYLWGPVSPVESGESNEGQGSFSTKLGVWDEIAEYFWGNRRSDTDYTEGYRGGGGGGGGGDINSGNPWMESRDKPTMDLYSLMALGLFTSFLAYIAFYFIEQNNEDEAARMLESRWGGDISRVIRLATQAIEKWTAFQLQPTIPNEVDTVVDEREKEEKREELRELQPVVRNEEDKVVNEWENDEKKKEMREELLPTIPNEEDKVVDEKEKEERREEVKYVSVVKTEEGDVERDGENMVVKEEEKLGDIQ